MIDRKRSFLNVFISIGFKIIILVLSFLSRRFLIRYIGNEANGINSLFTSIIGVLEVAELGVGSAITFSMYSPIINGDASKISALYQLIKKIYIIVGLIILVAGLIIMPFLPTLAKIANPDSSLYISFAFMLLGTILSYAFSAKVSLINAHKDNYITTTFSSIGYIVRLIFEISVAILLKSFIWYIFARVISTCIQWILTEIYIAKHHKKIVLHSAPLDKATRDEVIKNTKAMFMYKIGSVLVVSADSIIISAFLGADVLGKYSNYTTIGSALISILMLFFTPLTSVIGHMCTQKNLTEEKKYFEFFYMLNFVLGVVFFLGYYAIIDDLITVFFQNGLTMSRAVAIICTINQFIMFMRYAIGLFKDASGTFYYDRWKSPIEGVVNVVLSILFVVILKKYNADIGVVGVIVATILTNLFICDIVEPHVVYKYEFKQSAKKYYILNYSCIALFVGLVFLFDVVRVSNPDLNIWLRILANGFMAVGIALVPSILVFIFSKNFRKEFIGIFTGLHKHVHGAFENKLHVINNKRKSLDQGEDKK